jgi:hypothetical protein
MERIREKWMEQNRFTSNWRSKDSVCVAVRQVALVEGSVEQEMTGWPTAIEE